MDKKKLRKKYKNLRTQFTEQQRDEMSLEIANQALGLDIWEYDYYHLFLPIKHLQEVNTEYLLSILSGKDKHIVLSKSDFVTRSLQHFLLTDSTRISLSEYGIPEPDGGIEIASEKIQVVFLPLLAYDLLGNRVGYGKGFYDRFLSECPAEVLKIGLSYFEPEEEIISTKYTDVALNYCISPKKVYKY